MDNEYEQTRKRLGDGTLLQTFRANPPPGVRLRTDAELEDAQRSTSSSRSNRRPSCLWVWFADVEPGNGCRPDSRRARPRLASTVLLSQGTPEEPGATLALDNGTSRAYFDATLRSLERLGIHDAGIERLRRAILRADQELAGLEYQARRRHSLRSKTATTQSMKTRTLALR